MTKCVRSGREMASPALKRSCTESFLAIFCGAVLATAFLGATPSASEASDNRVMLRPSTDGLPYCAGLDRVIRRYPGPAQHYPFQFCDGSHTAWIEIRNVWQIQSVYKEFTSSQTHSHISWSTSQWGVCRRQHGGYRWNPWRHLGTDWRKKENVPRVTAMGPTRDVTIEPEGCDPNEGGCATECGSEPGATWHVYTSNRWLVVFDGCAACWLDEWIIPSLAFMQP